MIYKNKFFKYNYNILFIAGPCPGITGPRYPCDIGCPWLKLDIGNVGWLFGGISPAGPLDPVGALGRPCGFIIPCWGPLGIPCGGLLKKQK